MTRDWKTLLYRYASAHNEAAVSGDGSAWQKLAIEQNVIQREQARLDVIRQDWQRRHVRPLKCSTQAKHWLVTSSDSERLVVADLRLTRTLVYEQYGERYEEARSFMERVRLRGGTEGWRIESVTPLSGEHRHISDFFPGAWQHALDEETARGGSQLPGPLLNTYVLFGAEPASVRTSSRKIPYNRRRVKEYADRYWNSPNPSFLEFEVDCTNYVSQCLLAGGAPMNYTGRRDAGWWYQGRKKNRELWSYSWAVSNSLQHFLSTSRSGLQAEAVDSPYDLELGDVIIYDWDGDGAYQHATIVTGFDAAGEPLVNAHTMNSRARLWSYRDSPAWTERTRYRFFHIADFF